MNKFKLRRKKWFRERVKSFEIDFHGQKEFGNNYQLFLYDQNAPLYKIFERPSYPKEIQILGEYLDSLSLEDLFFESIKLQRLHKAYKLTSYVTIDYKTDKSKQKVINKYIKVA